MKIHLNDTEAAQVMATFYATRQLEMQMRELNIMHARHLARQAEIEKAIRARLKKLPKAPITAWQFNLDPVTFTGDVDVPDDKKEEKDG
ncbi:MAG: hypothetical protein JRD89_06045 [Deltaproteobacteria bacterium]|nr:hypothetical protein [Deltaproteobacteria bacterium]